MRLLRLCAPLLLLLVSGGCSASDADCGQLGEKFVVLYKADLSDEAKKLAPEILVNAAEAGRGEIVAQCKKEGFSKASVARCLDATTLAEFKAC